jgi:hypothetical protein
MEEESWLEDWLHDDDLGDCYLASLESLAEAWDRPEEDAAWAYGQIYVTPPYPLICWNHDPRSVSS